MKKISINTLFTWMIVLLVHGATSDSYTSVNGVTITTQNGKTYCDGIYCPPEASACHVTKRNDPNDFNQIIKTRKCLSWNGSIVLQESITEPNIYGGIVNTHISSGGGGTNVNMNRPLTPEEQKILDETLQNTEQLLNSLKPLQDPMFGINLANRINDEVHESLKNAFDF